MVKKSYIFILSAISTTVSLLAWSPANAVCPVCTVAVAAGFGLSRWLGIDDTVSGLWIGGLTMSFVIWTIDWLNGKKIRFFGRKPLILLCYYLLAVMPLYRLGVVGHPLNKLWGIDKLTLGIITGGIFFLLCHILHLYLKKKNNNKSYFPLQRVALPVSPLIILSLLFYFLAK